MEKPEGVGTAACSYFCHVPEYRLTGIQVHSGNEQQPALLVLFRYLCKHFLADLLFNKPPQGGIVCQGIADHRCQRIADFHDIIRREGRIKFPELGVVFRAEKGKRGRKSAGADSGHQLEFRPGSRISPTVEESGAKGTVVSAT